ncbi:MAG: dihydrolipoyl dehydrogenase [Candidatus Aminicenantales bacterium]
MNIQKDIAVIGGGPGGYVAALRAAQLGKTVVLFEKEWIGGTCMNVGCIPTKHLLHQTKILREIRTAKTLDGPTGQVTLSWARVQEEKRKVVDRLVRGVEFLLKNNAIEIVKGTAVLRDERHIVVRSAAAEETVYEAGAIILAHGSRPAELPFLKFDGTSVLSSTEALSLAEPPKTMAVIGAGAIGLEMGTIYSRLGTEVTVLEILASALPGCDREMGQRFELVLKKQGLKVLTQSRLESCARADDGRMVLNGTNLKTNASFEYTTEKVLLAAGRRPNSEHIAEGAPIVALDRRGFVQVNERLETNIPGIYAIGDLIGGKLLAHKASHEGIAAAENAAGRCGHIDYRALPMAVFTDPEFASIGLTEEESKAEAGEVRTGTFTFQANGRALTMDSPDGLVKIIADKNDNILGAHILGACASDLIAELTLAMTKGLKTSDIAESIHIHPTLSEAVMEAALKVDGRAIHCMN